MAGQGAPPPGALRGEQEAEEGQELRRQATLVAIPLPPALSEVGPRAVFRLCGFSTVILGVLRCVQAASAPRALCSLAAVCAALLPTPQGSLACRTHRLGWGRMA